MKLRQVFLLAVLVSLLAITVHADGVPSDARIIVGHGGDPDPCGLDFKIKLNKKGGGIKNCQNTSGFNWTGLDITASISVKSGVPDTLNCSELLGIFTINNCSNPLILKKFDHKEEIEIILSGGDGIASSGPNSFFFINLNTLFGSHDPNGAGGWSVLADGKPIDVQAVVASAPEPGTIILLLIGLGGVWFCQKRRPSPETKI